jgi:excisionase family DNA binding protein
VGVNSEQPRALTVRQVARQVGTTEATIRRWLRERQLHGVMPGGRRTGYRIPQTEVDRILEVR